MSGDVNIQTTNEECTEFVKRNQKERKDHIVDTNKMVTAVEWLIEHWKKLQSEGEKMTWKQIIDITELAKAMEKEQIKHAWCDGNPAFFDMFEEYYNKTYNK